MRIVFDSDTENRWHHEWMQRTKNAYEWWYADVVSDDGVWSLVAIYLIGNPFSSYYRQCKLGNSENPFVHNALFLALHKYARLHHYLFAKYPREDVILTPGIALDGKFGPNSLAFHPEDGGMQMSISELNGNNRHLDARITIRSEIRSAAVTGHSHQRDEHWWLPVIPAGRARADLKIRSLGVSREIERITFEGSGYHDHNWGTLPFDSTIANWTWIRVDFGSGTAAIIYWLVDTLGQSAVSLLYYEEHALNIFDRHASVDGVQFFGGKFGSRFPGRFTVSSGSVEITVTAMERLEDVPFYIRYRHRTMLRRGGSTTYGVGHGEFLKPGSMGTAPVAWGMSRRIFEPAIGR